MYGVPIIILKRMITAAAAAAWTSCSVFQGQDSKAAEYEWLASQPFVPQASDKVYPLERTCDDSRSCETLYYSESAHAVHHVLFCVPPCTPSHSASRG